MADAARPGRESGIALLVLALFLSGGCARLAQTTSSPAANGSASLAATASPGATPRIVAGGVEEIADPEGVARRSIAAETGTNPGDWKLLKAAVTTVGPYPDAAWSGKFLNAAAEADACVIVLPADRVVDCGALADLQAQAESQLTATAQQLYDDHLATLAGSPAAAAYVSTTFGIYAESLPDTSGIEGKPSPYDRVIVLEVEGYFPASHSCGFIVTACFDTAVELIYHVATDSVLHIAYLHDPASRDIPSPGPSLSERFSDLSLWGTPIPVVIAGQQ
jgi:hypothetical protein